MINPQCANAFINRGISHAEKGDYISAIADATRSFELCNETNDKQKAAGF